MNIQYEKRDYLITISGSIFAGLFIYFILSYLLISDRITILISVAISILIFGLTRYYSLLPVDTTNSQSEFPSSRNNKIDPIDIRNHEQETLGLSGILFAIIFVILIIVCSLHYKQDFHIFTSWNEINATGIIQLGAAIMLSFFVPGYALVRILTKKYSVSPILSILLGYILSILITGLTAYISAQFLTAPFLIATIFSYWFI